MISISKVAKLAPRHRPDAATEGKPPEARGASPANRSGRGYLVVPDPDLAVIQFYALTVYPTSSAPPSAFNSINALPRISSPAEPTCSSATTPSRKGRGESLSPGSVTAPATGTSAQGTRSCLLDGDRAAVVGLATSIDGSGGSRCESDAVPPL